MKIDCPCGSKAEYHKSSNHVYGRDFGPIYSCVCGRLVGVHRGTKKPLGVPADAETRKARIRAHAALDPLWKRHKNRTSAARKRRKIYRWLAAQLGIAEHDCHIGQFDIQTCDRVVEICTSTPPSFPNNTVDTEERDA